MGKCIVEECSENIHGYGFCNKHYIRFKKYGDPMFTKTNIDHVGICKVSGCNNSIKALGYCNKHYLKYREHGDPLHKKIRGVCKIEGCEDKVRGFGFCNEHYLNFKESGNPLLKRTKKTCSIDGCEGDIFSKWLCCKHYQKLRVHGDPLYVKPKKICSVVDCGENVRSLSLCDNHYQKYKKYGDACTVKREIHNLGHTPEYGVWKNIKVRCYDEGVSNYHRYGGRGITLCDRWKNSFVEFYKDMGPRPFPEAEIDRIDNDGNYEPGNCRWTTRLINVRNSTVAKLSMGEAEEIRIKYKTGNHTRVHLSKEYNVSCSTINRIISNKIWI